MLDELTASILDRVFVFTNSESLKATRTDVFLTFLSGYPSGQNQADFFIIAHLSNVLSHLSESEKNAINFIFLSKDKNLWKAFEFQCNLAGVKSIAPLIAITPIKPSKPSKSKAVVSTETSIELKILKIMNKPITATKIKQKLKLSDSVFTRSFNKLIKTGKIKRGKSSKKKWIMI